MNRWDELLREPEARHRAPRAENLANQIVLVTGGGGFIGSALAKSILRGPAKKVFLLDHSEENLFHVNNDLEAEFESSRFQCVLGDTADWGLLHDLFALEPPDIIFHAAAYKHVSLMEQNPFAVIQNNVLKTSALATIAVDIGVPRLLMISTDKAVNPRSIMGVSKRLAEMVLLDFNGAETQLSAVRFGNVFGSNGSVVPRFREQIAGGGPICVTHQDAARYFLTPGEAVELILAAGALRKGAGIFVPHLGQPLKIIELANRMKEQAVASGSKDMEIQFTGLRDGEKLTEELLGPNEQSSSTADALLFQVREKQASTRDLKAKIAQLSRYVDNRSLAKLVDAICELVPQYIPSATLLKASVAKKS